MDFKLGKLPAKRDSRNIKFKCILKPTMLPTLPETYDVDNDNLHKTIPEQVFGNDAWGDCVIAGRANQTMRFECFEQCNILPITEQDCLTEYWQEGGGDEKTKPDHGLVMLSSLKLWKSKGWIASSKKYDIHAFAEIDVKDHNDLKYAIMLLYGACIGFEVPESAMTQFYKGETWSVVSNSKTEGGHCVYMVGWNSIGPVCVTWGKKQQMTWEFYDKYTDEAYAIVDNRDEWIPNSPLDTEELEKLLRSITSNSDPVFTIEVIWKRFIVWLRELFNIH
jgi:hypothetical protein